MQPGIIIVMIHNSQEMDRDLVSKQRRREKKAPEETK